MPEKSFHQLRVEEFMRLAKQDLPIAPVIPSSVVRRLRANLMLEEVLEAVEGLGFHVTLSGHDITLNDLYEPDLVKIVDGCCDVKVVTTGTLSACGVPDVAVQRLVDDNNLDKFGPGHTIREDGKLIKPPGHQPPDIAGMLDILKMQHISVGDDRPNHGELYGEEVVVPPKPPAPRGSIENPHTSGYAQVVKESGWLDGSGVPEQKGIETPVTTGIGYRAEDDRLPFPESVRSDKEIRAEQHKRTQQAFVNAITCNEFRLIRTAVDNTFADEGDETVIKDLLDKLDNIIQCMEQSVPGQRTSNDPPVGGISQHPVTAAITD